MENIFFPASIDFLQVLKLTSNDQSDQYAHRYISRDMYLSIYKIYKYKRITENV